jgi:hypothetical protein
VSTKFLILIRRISRLFVFVFLGLIARGYGLAGPSARLSRATLLALLADLLCWVLFGAWLLGRNKYDCIWLAKFPPLLCIEFGR